MEKELDRESPQKWSRKAYHLGRLLSLLFPVMSYGSFSAPL